MPRPISASNPATKTPNKELLTAPAPGPVFAPLALSDVAPAAKKRATSTTTKESMIQRIFTMKVSHFPDRWEMIH